MKKRIIGLSFGAVLAVLLFISTASAQTLNAIATVDRVIQGAGGNVQLRLSSTDPALFQNKLFQINSGPQKDAQLAILLTAASTSKPVVIVFTDGNPAIISALGLSNE